MELTKAFKITTIVFITSTLFFLLGIVSNTTLLLYLSVIGIFTGFDIYGYQFMVLSSKKDYSRTTLISYRILQISFQLILSLFLLVINPLASILFLFSWWFGLCDLLFYIIQNINYLKYGSMFWLWWTPYGLILSLFKKKPKPIIFTVFSIFGFVVSIILIILSFFGIDFISQYGYLIKNLIYTI